MKGISAVVATYKRTDELNRLLKSIISNELQSIQVIIVDQNKNGLIDELVSEFHVHLDILHLKLIEPNQSRARNYGATLAKYPIICFPDDDCWFEKDSLNKLLDSFERNTGSEVIVINWKQNPRKVSTSFQINNKDMFSFRSVGYVTYVLFFKTDVFLKLGGFLESIGIGMYIGGGEDSELAFRAITKGYKLFFDAEVYVNHNYINIYNRPAEILRARQRAMGLMYQLYDVPYLIIFRGMLSPLFKMLFCFNFKKMRQHYNLWLARIEGYRYGIKNKHQIVNSISPLHR